MISLQCHYKNLLIQKWVEEYDKAQQIGSDVVDITILNAIRFAASAWSNVKKTTIMNCWKATRLIPCEETSSDTVIEDAKMDVSLSALEEHNSIQAVIDKLSFTDPINAEGYLCLDDDKEEAVFVNSIMDEGIVQMILTEEQT